MRSLVWTKRAAAGCVIALFMGAVPLDGQVSVGLRSGVNLANVSSSQFEFGRTDGRTALVGGGFLTVSGTRRVSFQTELLYSQKGISVLGLGGSAIAKVDYIDVPILVRVRLREVADRVRPYVLGGGFVSFETTCSATGSLTALDADGDCGGILPARGETDAGFVIGTGVDYGLADRFFLNLDGRLNLGILNLNWDEELDSVRSRVWSLTGGIGVLLGS